MKISQTKFYACARDKVCRLGVAHPFLELQEMILETEIYFLPKGTAANASHVRKRLDKRLIANRNWKKNASVGVDWVRPIRYNENFVARLGVEIHVSSRGSLL